MTDPRKFTKTADFDLLKISPTFEHLGLCSTQYHALIGVIARDWVRLLGEREVREDDFESKSQINETKWQ